MFSGVSEQYDCDLADMTLISKSNRNVKYLLTMIDDFSRYLYVALLQSKRAHDVLQGFKQIFKNAPIPRKVRTDGGGEFKNKQLKSYFDKLGIYHHITLNKVKANFAERVIQTLKNILYRYMNRYRTHKYIDVLQKNG